MIRLTRDGMIVHHTGIVVGSWQRTVDGTWQVWGGPTHTDLLSAHTTCDRMVAWVEANAVDEWGMVAALG